MKLWILKHGFPHEGSYQIDGIFHSKKAALEQLKYLKQEIKAEYCHTYRDSKDTRGAKVKFPLRKGYGHVWEVKQSHETFYETEQRWVRDEMGMDIIILEEAYTQPYAMSLDDKIAVYKKFLKKNPQKCKCGGDFKAERSRYKDQAWIRCKKCSHYLQYDLDRILDENCSNRAQAR